MLAAPRAFFRFVGWTDCQVKFLKLQRCLFRDTERELARTEYDRLLETAWTFGRERLALLMETIGATCLPRCSTGPAGILPTWRTCWAIPPLRLPGSTF